MTTVSLFGNTYLLTDLVHVNHNLYLPRISIFDASFRHFMYANSKYKIGDKLSVSISSHDSKTNTSSSYTIDLSGTYTSLLPEAISIQIPEKYLVLIRCIYNENYPFNSAFNHDYIYYKYSTSFDIYSTEYKLCINSVYETIMKDPLLNLTELIYRVNVLWTSSSQPPSYPSTNEKITDTDDLYPVSISASTSESLLSDYPKKTFFDRSYKLQDLLRLPGNSYIPFQAIVDRMSSDLVKTLETITNFSIDHFEINHNDEIHSVDDCLQYVESIYNPKEPLTKELIEMMMFAFKMMMLNSKISTFSLIDLIISTYSLSQYIMTDVEICTKAALNIYRFDSFVTGKDMLIFVNNEWNSYKDDIIKVELDSNNNVIDYSVDYKASVLELDKIRDYKYSMFENNYIHDRKRIVDMH